MSELDVAFEKVSRLVEDFRSNERHYKSAGYTEAQARLDFIDKFWVALGWDVSHDIQTNPYEQEVKVEKGVATGGTRGRADYAFYLKPNFHDVKFFVEAKKPAVDIATNESCFQLIRYGWNSGTPVAVLTDFEQLHILDCRYRPHMDTALSRTVAKYHYSEYTDRAKFEKIYWWFSREAVADGSIEKRAKELKKPHRRAIQRGLFPGGYQSIDEHFLAELDAHRITLAKAFKKHRPDLDSETLTELVQRTLDRLVFLRFLEDKGIEPTRLVEHFGDKALAWEEFIAACKKLNKIYNGIIYRPHEILDSPTFVVDDTAFGGICEDLAQVNSPYDFNAIPIHILGSIYERFLGKVIEASPKRVKVVEKPEVRKAGGVYYTPEYIVRYIVENTVGKLIDGKRPAQIAKMRFADIACGSGSFLLGVYDLLLKYHGLYYNEKPGRAKKGECVTRDGKLYLTLAKKREILLNNIYGVDIDAQAVEVCQLSLYLKLLQEETEASAKQYLLDFAHEARMKQLLPDLRKNIVCGNSLIGWDIDDDLFGNGEIRKLNPMDFESSFPEVMKHGGFDAVVGNPPYRRELDYKYLMDQIALGAFGRKYRSPRMDLWYYFVHRGLEILRPNGLLSFIVNGYWTSGTGAQKLITSLSDSAHLDEVFVFGKLRVFQNVSGQHMILRSSHAPSSKPCHVKLVRPDKETTAEQFVVGTAPVEAFDKPVDQLFRHGKVDLQPSAPGLMAKLDQGTPLADFGIVRQGIAENPASVNRKTNERFGNRWRVGEGVFTLRPEELRDLRLSKAEKALLRPYHDLCDLDRYSLADRASLSLIYSTRRTCPDIAKHPRLRAHLKRFRPIMEKRRETRNNANRWWHLHWPRDEGLWQTPKIVALQMAKRPSFAVARRPVYVPFSVNVFVPKMETSEDLNYFAGLLNSKLLWSWYSHYAKRRGVGLEINGNVLTRTPIRTINFSDPADKKRHDEMVTKVEAMLEAKKKLAKAQTDKDKNFYERRCTSLDREIDRLVYDLYDLTDDEIAIVEGTTE